MKSLRLLLAPIIAVASIAAPAAQAADPYEINTILVAVGNFGGAPLSAK